MMPPRHGGFGTTVTTLPNGYRVITHNRTRYYVHDNVYYQQRGGGYVIVRSPYL